MLIKDNSKNVKSSIALQGNDIEIDQNDAKKLISILGEKLYSLLGSTGREYWANTRESVAEREASKKNSKSVSQGQLENTPTKVIFPYTEEMLLEFSGGRGSTSHIPADDNRYYNFMLKYHSSGKTRIENYTFTMPTHYDSLQDVKENRAFIIRDYGIGMDKDTLIEMITKATRSSKEDSNEYGGGLGIGTLSGRVISDSVTFTAYKDGKMSQLLMAISNNKWYMLAEEVPTDEPDGMQVELEMRDMALCRKFVDQAMTFFAFAPEDECLDIVTPVINRKMFYHNLNAAPRFGNGIHYIPVDKVVDNNFTKRYKSGAICYKEIKNYREIRTADKLLNATSGIGMGTNDIKVSVNGIFYKGIVENMDITGLVKEHISDIFNPVFDKYLNDGKELVLDDIAEKIYKNMRSFTTWCVPIGYLGGLIPSREGFVLSTKEINEYLHMNISHIEDSLRAVASFLEVYCKLYSSVNVDEALELSLEHFTGDYFKVLKRALNESDDFYTRITIQNLLDSAMKDSMLFNSIRNKIKSMKYGNDISLNFDTSFLQKQTHHIEKISLNLKILSSSSELIGIDLYDGIGITITEHINHNYSLDKATKKYSGFYVSDKYPNSIFSIDILDNKNSSNVYNIAVVENTPDSIHITSTSKSKGMTYWRGLFLDFSKIENGYKANSKKLSAAEDNALMSFMKIKDSKNRLYVSVPGHEELPDRFNKEFSALKINTIINSVNGAYLRDALSKILKEKKEKKDPVYHMTYSLEQNSELKTGSIYECTAEDIENFIRDKYNFKDYIVLVVNSTNSNVKRIECKSMISCYKRMYNVDNIVLVYKGHFSQKDSNIVKNIQDKFTNPVNIALFEDINFELFTQEMAIAALEDKEISLDLLTAYLKRNMMNLGENETDVEELFTNFKDNSAIIENHRNAMRYYPINISDYSEDIASLYEYTKKRGILNSSLSLKDKSNYFNDFVFNKIKDKENYDILGSIKLSLYDWLTLDKAVQKLNRDCISYVYSLHSQYGIILSDKVLDMIDHYHGEKKKFLRDMIDGFIEAFNSHKIDSCHSV